MSLTATGRRRPNEREPKTIRARATTSDVVKISRKTCRCCAARDFSDSRLADSRSARIQNAHTYKQSTAVLVESPRERERQIHWNTDGTGRERAKVLWWCWGVRWADAATIGATHQPVLRMIQRPARAPCLFAITVTVQYSYLWWAPRGHNYMYPRGISILYTRDAHCFVILFTQLMDDTYVYSCTYTF